MVLFSGQSEISIEKSQSTLKLKSDDNISNKKLIVEDKQIGLSQPVPQKENIDQINSMNLDKENICFSQPAHFDDLLISSQFQFTQSPITKVRYNQ